MITVLKYVGLVVFSYLMGSIMFAKLLSKTQKKDISDAGSGNPGSMNMLRNHGFLFGFLNLTLDALKGAIPALCGFFLFGGFNGGIVARSAIYIAGVSAVIGHCFPIFFKFKGGKGVATTMGFCMVAHPFIVLGIFAGYVVLFVITRIGSLCSLICAIVYLVVDTVLLCLEHNYVGLGCLIAVVLLIVWAHRSNIKRLIEKRENVIDLKAVAQKDADRIHNLKEKSRAKADAKHNKTTQVENDEVLDSCENSEVEDKTATDDVVEDNTNVQDTTEPLDNESVNKE